MYIRYLTNTDFKFKEYQKLSHRIVTLNYTLAALFLKTIDYVKVLLQSHKKCYWGSESDGPCAQVCLLTIQTGVLMPLQKTPVDVQLITLIPIVLLILTADSGLGLSAG